MRSSVLRIAVLVVVIACSGLPGAAGAAPAFGPSTAPATRPTTAPARPIAEVAAKAFVADVEKSINAGDASVLAAAVDGRAITDASLAGLDAPFAMSATLYLTADKLGRDIAGALVQQIKAGGSYRFLRLHGPAAARRATFRLVTKDGGFAYHDLPLALDDADRVRVVDFDPLNMGEPLSQTLRRTQQAVIADARKPATTRPAGGEGDWLTSAAQTQEFTRLTNQGKAAEALAVYDKLPEAVRREKFHLIQRIGSARAIDVETHKRAMADFERLYPDDPALLTFQIDLLGATGRYDDALAAVDRLDRRVGGDPYLDLSRAGILMQKRDDAAARKRLEQLVATEPKLASPYFTLIGLSLKRKDHAETTRLIELAEAKAGLWFNLDQMQKGEPYAEYVKSAEFARRRDRVIGPATRPAPEPATAPELPPMPKLR